MVEKYAFSGCCHLLGFIKAEARCLPFGFLASNSLDNVLLPNHPFSYEAASTAAILPCPKETELFIKDWKVRHLASEAAIEKPLGFETSQLFYRNLAHLLLRRLLACNRQK